MSSLVRRLGIRIMKRARYTREKWIIVPDPSDGKPMVVDVKRGGEITDPDDAPIGRNWPLLVPARIAPPPRPQRINAVPRAMRRCKPNKRLVAARKARAAQ